MSYFFQYYVLIICILFYYGFGGFAGIIETFLYNFTMSYFFLFDFFFAMTGKLTNIKLIYSLFIFKIGEIQIFFYKCIITGKYYADKINLELIVLCDKNKFTKLFKKFGFNTSRKKTPFLTLKRQVKWLFANLNTS